LQFARGLGAYEAFLSLGLSRLGFKRTVLSVVFLAAPGPRRFFTAFI
jgi:hypothetical protein